MFERAMDELKAEVSNAAGHSLIDSEARAAYTRLIAQMSSDLTAEVHSGAMTWRGAAMEAQQARNIIMETIRNRTTPVGLAKAQTIKQEGKTLDTLVEQYTTRLFGKQATFDALPPVKQNEVFAEIVASAGRSRPEVTAAMKRASRFARGLIVLSLLLSAISIAEADDKVDAVKHEGATTLAGIGGGIAGGAAAGLVCGPGAPLCVTVGAVVGGALAAFGVDYFHLW